MNILKHITQKNIIHAGKSIFVILLPLILFLAPRQANASWSWVGDLATTAAIKIGAGIALAIGTLLQDIVFMFSSASGLLLDNALKLNFALIVHRPVIEIGWIISRDIANIFFIIVLLGIAIATIFKISNYQAKALLPKLIIIALLINFSLAIGFAIIDFTHVLGTQFYASAVSSYGSFSSAIVQGTKSQAAISFEKCQSEELIKILEKIDPRVRDNKGLLNILTQGDPKYIIDAKAACATRGITPVVNTADELLTKAKKVWSNAILLSVMVFVLFAAAVMMYIRIAVLSLLLILAPLAYLFYIIPDLQSLAKKWWSSFLSHAFFLPAFLMIMYFVIRFTTTIGQFTGEGDLLSPNIFFTYVLAVVMLVAALIIGRMMGVYGAGAVINITNKARKFAVGYAGGAALRQTVGRAGMALQRKEGVQRSHLGNRIAGGMAGVGKKLPGGSRSEQVEKQAEFEAERVLKQSPNTWGGEFANLGTHEARSKFLEKVPEKNRGRFIAGLPPEQRQIALNALRLKGSAKVREFEKAETQYSIAQARNTPGSIAGYFAGLPNEEARERAFRDAHPRDRVTYLEQQFNNPATRATMPNQMRRFANELETNEQEKLYKDIFREAPTRLVADIGVYQNIPEGIRRDIANSQPSRMAAISRANASIDADIVRDIRNAGAEDKYINAPGAALRRYWQDVFARHP